MDVYKSFRNAELRDKVIALLGSRAVWLVVVAGSAFAWYVFR